MFSSEFQLESVLPGLADFSVLAYFDEQSLLEVQQAMEEKVRHSNLLECLRLGTFSWN